ncbi:MBL fold metallo-hydrolase [Adhaeribacter radiodurans]|uniref:MBL fold metallo-hydrolase n=2 Tax=Adhaeribacter radiodurans TaxID=2745197 RepID=A0A7L7LFA7_9BACT|nr:MBL fold metallo-hydrolase [Adhaeribacter radiodurans]QMU31546.1 MBL fold metallo-hydrolase [Adhaeribacter radiodurans]
MLKYLFVFLLAFSFYEANAQRSKPDQLATKKGSVTIQPVLHGSVVFTWNNKTIYVDPYGGAAAFSSLTAPDLILITDIHGDHADLKTLEAINTTKAKFIVPAAVAEMLPANLKSKATILKNGDQTIQYGMGITAVPMYNLPETADSRHPKGRGNGYVLNIGGKNIYLSGDTEDIPEMKALQNIDVAFVCMNLPFTMDINQAAEALLAFKPKVVYPYHYRGQDGLSDVEAFKKLVNDKNAQIDVRLRGWYPSN